MGFLRLACTCEETCLSVWPPNASLYASSTCAHLRLLAGPFDQSLRPIDPFPSLARWHQQTKNTFKTENNYYNIQGFKGNFKTEKNLARISCFADTH